MFKSCGERQRHLALQYCRGLCTYGRSRGHWETFARENEVPCDLWYSCLRLSFVVEVRLLWSFLWLAQWFLYGLYCKGFWSGGRVSPCTSLLIGQNVCMPMYWFVTVVIKSWKTSAVSSTVWMVETQLCKLRGTSDALTPPPVNIALIPQQHVIHQASRYQSRCNRYR